MEKRPFSDVVLVAAFLAVTGIGAFGHSSLTLDVSEREMDSTGTETARTRERLDQEFGEETSFLVMLEPRGAAVSGDPDDPEVAGWLAQVREWPEISGFQILPASGPQATLLKLEARGGGTDLPGLLDRLDRTAPPTHRVSLTGHPVARVAIARALAAEQTRILPAVLIALAGLLLLTYRRLSLGTACLLPGLGAVFLLDGLRYLIGDRVTAVSALLAPVVLTVGVAAAVHVVERYLMLLREGPASRDVPSRAMRSLVRPVILTAATTVAGFMALAMNSIPAVRKFGLLAAVGVLLALGSTLLVLPAWLRLTRKAGRHSRTAGAPSQPRLIPPYLDWLKLRSTWVVGAAVLAGVGLAWRGAHVPTDTRPERVLPADHPFRVQTDRFAARFGGVETFDLFLPAPLPPAWPVKLAVVTRDLLAEDGVVSLAGEPRRSGIGSLLLPVLLSPAGTHERLALFDRAASAAHREGFQGAAVAGTAVQVARDSESLVRDQKRGVLAMLALIWVVMSLGFRSWRLGSLAVLPNAVPCIAIFGGLELTGHALSVPAGMIATVFLGLIVDDTIHFLDGYLAAMRRGAPAAEAISSALSHAGKAIVVTSVVLAVGFGTGIVGHLATTVEFAILSSATILLALGCDLVLLPAALLLAERRLPARVPTTDLVVP